MRRPVMLITLLVSASWIVACGGTEIDSGIEGSRQETGKGDYWFEDGQDGEEAPGVELARCIDQNVVDPQPEPEAEERVCNYNGNCNADEYCHIPDGICLNPTFGILQGVCRPRPQNCAALVNEVCGCDRQTYSNTCEAYRAGKSVGAAGPC